MMPARVNPVKVSLANKLHFSPVATSCALESIFHSRLGKLFQYVILYVISLKATGF